MRHLRLPGQWVKKSFKAIGKALAPVSIVKSYLVPLPSAQYENKEHRDVALDTTCFCGFETNNIHSRVGTSEIIRKRFQVGKAIKKFFKGWRRRRELQDLRNAEFAVHIRRRRFISKIICEGIVGGGCKGP